MEIEQIIGQPVVAIVILLGALIFFHELGHFLVGRLCGVGIEVFSIGFGPSLVNINYKNTSYKICLIPLGGYVKFAGAINEEPVPEVFHGKEFFAASRLRRASIIAAGPGANFLLAVVCYTFIAHAGIPQFPAFLGQIRSGSPADKVGLQSQDVVIAINDKAITYWSELQETIALSPISRELKLSVLRDGLNLDFFISPGANEVEDEMGKRQKQNVIGVGLEYILPILTVSDHSPAFNAGLRTGQLVSTMRFNGLTKMLTSSDEIFIFLEQAHSQGSDTVIFVTQQLPENSQESGKDPAQALTAEFSLSLSFLDETKLTVPGLTLKERGKVLASTIGIYDSQLTLKTVKADALKPFLQPYDRLIRFNDFVLEDVYSLAHAFELSESDQAQLEILRGRDKLKLTVPLQSYEVQKVGGKALAYYMDLEMLGTRKAPELVLQKFDGIFAAIAFSLAQTAKHSGMIVGGIYNLITGNLPLKALGGAYDDC